MKRDDIEKLCEVILEWCVKKFGESKYHDEIPLVLVETTLDGITSKDPIKGEYDPYDNYIWVSSSKNRSVRQYARTVLHEYRHYTQHPSWIRRYLSVVGHKKSPYEREATAFEENHIDECMRYLERNRIP